MNTHREALRINDAGIYRLLEHKYEEAVFFFRDAVFLSKAMVIHKEQCSSSHHQEQFKPSGHTRLDLQLDFIDLECYHKTMTHEKFVDLNGSNDNMICKTAISICCGDMSGLQDGAETPSANHVAIAASVTYNLAIAIHLWALQLGSHEKLRLALYYYEIAYRLQSQEEKNESNLTLMISVLNNAANIYHVLGDYDVSKLFLEELMAILPQSQNTRQTHQAVNWENILSLMLGPPTAASAA